MKKTHEDVPRKFGAARDVSVTTSTAVVPSSSIDKNSRVSTAVASRRSRRHLPEEAEDDATRAPPVPHFKSDRCHDVDPKNAAVLKEEDKEMGYYEDDEVNANKMRGLTVAPGGGQVEVPPPMAPTTTATATTNLTPGAIRVRGIHGQHAEDDPYTITVMTPVDQRAASSRPEILAEAELVQDMPVAAAEPEPEAPWWSKRRNMYAMAVAIVLLVAVVVALVMSGSLRGSSSAPADPNTATGDGSPTLAPSMVTDDTWVQVGRVLDGEAALDRSGTSIALSAVGHILAVGANRNNGNGSDSGHVRVYRFENGDWVQFGGDIDGEALTWSGYSVALSTDGHFLAVGAPNFAPGRVRVHHFENAEWAQVGGDLEGEAGEGRSGASVALSADGLVVAVGSHFIDGSGSSAGHVRVHRLENGGWVQVGKDLDGEAEGDYSGFSVALSADGNVVAVGAPRNDGSGIQAGHVRIHRLENGEWQQLGADINGKGTDAYLGGDNSGIGINSAVSLSSNGTMVAVGAPAYNGETGYVQVYRWDNQGWIQVGQDLEGKEVDDWFGTAISLSDNGEIVAIGARQLGKRGDPPGYVGVFHLDTTNGETWLPLGQELVGEGVGDRFGYSVDLSSDGHTLAVGAPQNNNANGEAAGQVRVFQLE